MEPANQSLFNDPKEYNRLKAMACGVSRNGIRGGLSFVTEDKVRAGETIFRIGHSNLPMTLNMSSPWWIREAAFDHIMETAAHAGSDPQELFRMKCAVSYDFGVSDIVLEARLNVTLRAFAGHGRPVIDDSDDRKGQVWFGSLEIAQLFIPGLRDHERKVPTPLCHAAINIIEKFKVCEYIHVQRRRQKWLRKHSDETVPA
jgi:hypothetical protein